MMVCMSIDFDSSSSPWTEYYGNPAQATFAGAGTGETLPEVISSGVLRSTDWPGFPLTF
jgi:hypothetical protein